MALLSDEHSSDACPFDCLHSGRKQECRCPHRASLPSSTIPKMCSNWPSAKQSKQICHWRMKHHFVRCCTMLYVQFNLLHCAALASSMIWSCEYLEERWSKSVQLLPLTWLGKDVHSFGRTTLDYLDYLDSAICLPNYITLLSRHASLGHRSKKSSPRTMGLLDLTIAQQSQHILYKDIQGANVKKNVWHSAVSQLGGAMCNVCSFVFPNSNE